MLNAGDEYDWVDIVAVSVLSTIVVAAGVSGSPWPSRC